MVGEVRTRSKKDIEEDVERLKDWLYKQPHLPHDVEEELLSAFVQGTKSLEIAKKKLDGFYATRNKGYDLYCFKNRDPSTETFIEHCKPTEQFFLPKATPEGYRVLIIRLKKEYFDNFDHPNAIIRMLMLLELGFLRWPDTPGYYSVMDMTDLTAGVVSKLSPSALSSFASCFQEGFPLKVKGIFVTNATPIVEFVANNLYKPLMKEKLYKRIKITSKDISAFFDRIPQDIFPSDFGGGKEKPSVELNEYWLNQLVEHRSWFEHTSKQMSDESKRPPDESNTYGIDGTFRKLAVD